jgi:hypothetical protein
MPGLIFVLALFFLSTPGFHITTLRRKVAFAILSLPCRTT